MDVAHELLALLERFAARAALAQGSRAAVAAGYGSDFDRRRVLRDSSWTTDRWA